jgi:hypothetical protein
MLKCWAEILNDRDTSKLTVMDALHAYRSEVQATGGSTAAADALVEAIARSQDSVRLPQLFTQLATESDRLGWFRDSDYAAVALQVAYVQAASTQLRKAMLGFALERARWCASCATAGGEGLSRSRHVRELEALARSDVQPFTPADGFAAR